MEINYEQKYNEALERANEQLNGAKVFDYDNEQIAHDIRSTVYNIFPELKESESKDERIRKKLIELFHDTVSNDEIFSDYGLDKTEVLDLLEKQGEQNLTWGEEQIKVYQEVYADILSAKGFDLATINSEIKRLKEQFKSAILLKKQCKQNPVDKVESKFKEGDWVFIELANGYKKGLFQIKNVDCFGYSFDEYFTIPFIYKNVLSKWTIDDAKDGDVLWHSDSASNGVFIFKEIRYDGKVLCYCDYDSEDHFCLGEHHTCCWSNDKYIKPATKEQRNLLFTKMKEAGYEWNADKKELIKL